MAHPKSNRNDVVEENIEALFSTIKYGNCYKKNKVPLVLGFIGCTFNKKHKEIPILYDKCFKSMFIIGQEKRRKNQVAQNKLKFKEN